MSGIYDRALTSQAERARLRLLDRLEQRFPAVTLSSLKRVREDLEEVLREEIVLALLENAEEIFRLRRSPGGRLVDANGNGFQLRCGRSIRAGGELEVFLQPDGFFGPESMRETEIHVAGFGDVACVRFLYVEGHGRQVRMEILQLWVRTVLEGGYDWFCAIACHTASYQLADLATLLYGHVRKRFGRGYSGENFWFSAIYQGMGFRLIDPKAAEAAFWLVQRNNSTRSHSPSEYVVDLLATVLDERVMLMRTAIDGGACVEVDVRTTAYARDGSLYALTLRALYGQDSFTVFPIFRSLPLSVGAVFASADREHVENFLEATKDSLADICDKFVVPPGAPRGYLASRIWDSLGEL